MYDQVCQVLYGYILQAEMLFLRYYKTDPFQIMKGIPLVDLQVYIKDEDNKAHRPDERDMMPW